MVIEKLAEALCWGLVESFTVTFAVAVPAGPAGVPLITPVVALIVNPEGKPVADQVYGAVPPVAARFAV